MKSAHRTFVQKFETPFWGSKFITSKGSLRLHTTGAAASFVFSEERCQTTFLQFGYRRAKKIASVQRDAIPLALGFQ